MMAVIVLFAFAGLAPPASLSLEEGFACGDLESPMQDGTVIAPFTRSKEMFGRPM
jgi:hypothetical protein